MSIKLKGQSLYNISQCDCLDNYTNACFHAKFDIFYIYYDIQNCQRSNKILKTKLSSFVLTVYSIIIVGGPGAPEWLKDRGAKWFTGDNIMSTEGMECCFGFE